MNEQAGGIIDAEDHDRSQSHDEEHSQHFAEAPSNQQRSVHEEEPDRPKREGDQGGNDQSARNTQPLRDSGPPIPGSNHHRQGDRPPSAFQSVAQGSKGGGRLGRKFLHGGFPKLVSRVKHRLSDGNA